MTGGQDHSGDAVRQRLAEISERASAATVGPWKAEFDGGLGERLDIVYVLGPDRSLLAVTQTMDNASEGKPLEDAAFIGAARQDVPRLVAALTGTPEKPGVLDLHHASNAGRVCIEDGLWWPCPTYRAVAAALEEQP